MVHMVNTIHTKHQHIIVVSMFVFGVLLKVALYLQPLRWASVSLDSLDGPESGPYELVFSMPTCKVAALKQ